MRAVVFQVWLLIMNKPPFVIQHPASQVSKSRPGAPNHLWMVRHGALGCALTVYQLIHCKVLKIWEGG